MVTTETFAEKPSERLVGETFRQVWSNTDPRSLSIQDPLCLDIANVLLARIPQAPNAKVLEAGSGTGRISAVLARAGYEVTLLDICQEALEISRQVFQAEDCKFRAVQGSLFSIPFPDGYFDVVWNAGVVEHFYFSEQVLGLKEMARVLAPQGILITLNPSARGWIYRLGKTVAETRGLWTAGQEFPVTTLKPQCEKLGLRLLSEEEVIPDYQFMFLGKVGKPFQKACRRSSLLHRATLKVFGGYLKLSVIAKPPSLVETHRGG